MTQTARYDLPLLQSGQAQKEVTHNEAIAQIDALLHLAVESRTVGTPPAAAEAAAWIVAAAATGTWAGHSDQIAVFDDSGWSFVTPRDGCVAFVRDEGIFVCRVAGAWVDGWPVRSLTISGRPTLAGPLASVMLPSGGMTIDAEARAAVGQLTAALTALGLVAGS